MERLQPVRDPKTLDTVEELDAICFNDDGFENLREATEISGDIYALWQNDAIIGYTVYGQVWLPMNPYGYISRIGIYPDHRQQGWGLKLLKTILTDLSSRPNCPAVFADIRQTNIASQCLFRKAGFSVCCEHDTEYPDEIGIRVVKYLKEMEVSP